ncbi:MAG: tyrosine--tRNA ligase [Clostridiales bacterium]|nr:tyrosine--tRNA ligase [Clostridiales bacterium]
MVNALDILRQRGFLKQITFEDELYALLGKEPVTFYVGFDPTADSLHIGHYIPVMAMTHLQRCGHRPIALVGGGTVMVGDPTGKTEMRQMLTREEIIKNAEAIKRQLSRFLDFGEGKAVMVDNADWLLDLNYIDFLREVGAHFSVNRMLTAECYRMRMEKGLSFLEFNYMLMQAYDFLVLNQRYGCALQMGGDDQWSNILAGADLIRRKEGNPAYCCTFNLLTTGEGKKMGKTEKGALWLDAERTTPYEFYQYWRNIEDDGVKNALLMLTFLPVPEIERLTKHMDERINEAKRVLAFEVTCLIHGEEEAGRARAASEALFEEGGSGEDIPTTVMTEAEFAAKNRVAELLYLTGLARSIGEGRRLIAQNAVSVDGERVEDTEARLDAGGGERLLRKGKKGYHRIRIGG